MSFPRHIHHVMPKSKPRKHGILNKLIPTRRSPFLRSIGFEVPFIFGHNRNLPEQPKSIIQTSRRLALARSGVHILPSAISITIICLNLFHSYLGRTLPGSIIDPSINIALLQVAAKAQELLIVASMTTIVMHIIRQELCAGASVPLGMISGGFMFTTLSYFWSPELWGSLGAKCSWATRSRLYGILVIGGIVAALAGPASAVLLIPKEQQWNAGGTKIFLPGSPDVWWPDMLNGSDSDTGNVCSTGALPEHGICSTGGYSSFWNARDKLDIFGKPAYLKGSQHNATTNLLFGPQGVDIANGFRLLPAMRYSGSYRGYACETAVVGIRTAEAMYHQQILHDWRTEVRSIPWATSGRRSTLSEYKYYTSLTSITSSSIPAVRISCTPAQDISQLERNIEFPVLDPDGCTGKARATRLFYVADLNDSPYQMSFNWIDLPDTFGTVSAGLVVKLPWGSSNDSRAVIGCSVDARWTNGSIITSDLRSFSTWSNLAVNFKAPDKLSVVIQGQLTAIGQPNYSEFRPVILNRASRRIVLKPSWLFSPSTTATTTTSGSAWTASNLESFLSGLSLTDGLPQQSTNQADFWNSETPDEVNRTVALEWSLALLITDALSRTGSELALNSSGPTSIWTLNSYTKTSDFGSQLLRSHGVGTALLRPTNKPVVEESIIITIGGYSYAATNVIDYASIALLLVHLLLALCHTLYTVCYTSQSSSAWDTLTELMALMQNSRPADRVLRNANAGIKETGTYGVVGRLYATTRSKANQETESESGTNPSLVQNEEEEEMSNVELIFDKPPPPSDPNQEEARVQASAPSDVLLSGVRPDVKYAHPPPSQYQPRVQTCACGCTSAHRPPLRAQMRSDRRYSI
jgi:hypothetical protein